MNNVMIPGYKLLSQVIKKLAPPGVQVATQYLGRSIDPKWSNGEIIIACETSFRGPVSTMVTEAVTIVVLTSGDPVFDGIVCEQILTVNIKIGARVLLVSDASSVNKLKSDTLKTSEFFLQIGVELSPRDTAETILEIVKAPFFNSEILNSVILKRLQSMGFRKSESISIDNKLQWRPVNDLWSYAEMTSLFTNEDSSSRSLVLNSKRNADVFLVKRVSSDEIDESLKRVNSLTQALISSSTMTRVVEDQKYKYHQE